MRFALGDPERALETEARQFAQTVLEPIATALDQRGGFPHASLQAAAAAGWLGVNVPRALGGREGGALGYALAVMQWARACPSTTVAMCVSNMVAEVVHAFGRDDQRETWVPRLCDGRAVVGAFALSEAGAGSDPASMATRATRTADGWILDGTKLWITSGSDAGLFVVWARTSARPGSKGISCFLLPGDTPGVERGQPERKMGLHGSTTTPLAFHEVKLPADALLHAPEDGFRVAMMALDGGRIGIAAQAIGIGRAALEDAALGPAVPDAHGEATLAQCEVDLAAAEALVLRAAWLKDQGRRFSREAAMAKLFATERAFAVCERVLSVLGPAGHVEGGRAQRCFRDVRVTMIYEGTSEIQRVVLARDVHRRTRGDA